MEWNLEKIPTNAKPVFKLGDVVDNSYEYADEDQRAGKTYVSVRGPIINVRKNDNEYNYFLFNIDSNKIIELDKTNNPKLVSSYYDKKQIEIQKESMLESVLKPSPEITDEDVAWRLINDLFINKVPNPENGSTYQARESVKTVYEFIIKLDAAKDKKKRRNKKRFYKKKWL